MKKRVLSFLLCCVLLLGLMPTAVFAEGSTAPADITGEGTAENPYLIYTAEGLKQFRDKVNGGENGAHAKLMADIVLNDGTFDKDGNYTPGESGKAAEEWTPIGWFELVDRNHPYTGTFDGGGFTIKGLYVNNPKGYAGLFGYIAFGRTSNSIQNITVEGYVSGHCAGGIVARSNGVRLLRCTNRAVVSGTYYSGGMIGDLGDQFGAEHKLELCFNAGEVLSPTKNGFTGGLIGALYSECHASITNCANAAKLTGKNVGGLIGYASRSADVLTIENCYSTAQFNADATRTGGIVGWPQDGLNVIITNSYWLEGTAEGVSYGDHANTTLTNVEAKSKAEFADGTVLNLLQNGDANSPWGKCGYLSAAGMIVPLLKGQTSDTFPIYTAEELKAFRDAVNGGDTGIRGKLMADIDLGNEPWTPIGSEDKPYTGTFDGNGKKITGLYVDERGKNTSAGLFGYIEISSSGAPVIQNLTVDGTVFAGNEVPEEPVDYYGAGILVGEITVLAGSGVEYGTVKNCHVSGTVSSPLKVGGLAGETKSTHFENCTADVEVAGTTSESRYQGAYSGGFVGRAFQSEFKDCVAYGNVTSANASTGGFAGLLYYETTVTHCAAYGNVESDDWNIGGFVGYVEEKVTIKNSIAMGDVVSNYDRGTAKAGGFAGVASTGGDAVTFEKCHANGKVTTAEGKVGYGMFAQVYRSDFKSIGCSYNSEKNPSLDATDEGAWEGVEGKNTAGVLSDVCVNYKGGHDMEDVAAVAATCTEDGSTAGQRCKDCGHTEGITVINAPGHKHSDVWSVDETNHWHECDECEAKLDAGKHTDTDKDHKCDVCEKAISNHSGGTATCKDKAVCEVCGESYGELAPNNHTDLKHSPAKAATKTDEGSIEYWYCSGCGKYYADKDGLKEITKADTVTARLPIDGKSPQTGDHSDFVLWMVLLLASGGVAVLTAAVGRKRKSKAK